jgi:amino acid transporter
VVAVPALFLNLTMVTDLCSIGTLFAFVLVCAGVLVLQNKPGIPRGKFKTPYINAKYIAPILLLGGLVFAFVYNKQSTMDFLTNEKQINTPEAIVTALSQTDTKIVYEYLIAKNENDATITDLEALLSKYSEDDVVYRNTIDSLPIAESVKYESGFALFKHKIPMWIFLVVLIGLVIWAIRKTCRLFRCLGWCRAST